MKGIIYFFSLVFISITPTYSQYNGCWVTLYDRVNFSGEQINIYEGIDLPTMSLSNVASLITGPNARITLYGEEYWLDRDFIVEPDTKIQNFEELPWNNIASLRMICVPDEE